MSLHTHLKRGFVALPVAAVLVAAGALSNPRTATSDCDRVVVEATPALPRAVDFHSMLPGALHIVKRVKVGEG